MAEEGRHLVVVAGERLAALAGFEGELPRGRVTLVAPERREQLAQLEPDAVLDLDGPPPGAGTVRVPLPLPVADEIYDLPPPARPAGILVVGGPEEIRQVLVDRLAGRYVDAASKPHLERADLAAAAGVVMLGPIDGPLSAGAMAVLAARRVLIVPRSRAALGLLPDIDHLAYRVVDQAADYADAVATHWLGFESMRAMGALAAEHHRASRAYARLLVDLEIGGAGLPSSAGSPGG